MKESKCGPLDLSYFINGDYKKMIPTSITMPKLYYGSNLFGIDRGDRVSISIFGQEDNIYIVTAVDFDGTIHVEPTKDQRGSN